MAGIRDGLVISVGSWFNDNITREVGDGGSTYFWTGNWVGVSLFVSGLVG